MTSWARGIVGIALSIATAVCVSVARADDPSKSNSPRPDLPYQALQSEPIVHDVDFQVVVTPPYGCKVLKVWLPLAQSDDVQEISNRELTTFPNDVTPAIAAEPVYGNTFAYFEFPDPQGAQIIRHRFTARVHNLHWNLEPDKVESVASWPKSFDPYLRAQPITSSGEFNRLLAQLVPQKRGPARDLFAVLDWADKNLTYDHGKASLRADADQAFSLKAGHCSDYHGLCATMGRALGYPTRVTYGLTVVPKSSPSHCKLEAFLPPYGWVSFDVSETQKLVRSIEKNNALSQKERARWIEAARSRLRHGFRENSWLLVTRGTDYEIVPKSARPVRVVRTIYAEADGVALPDPDPANRAQHEFAWMTAHRYTSDTPFALPFNDVATLKDYEASEP